MSEQRAEPPWPWLLIGTLAAIVGGVIGGFGLGATDVTTERILIGVGALLAFAGAVSILIASIAIGVTWGLARRP